MKKKFTELSVEKMAPVPGKRLEAFDTLTPGLALRITEGGKKSWSVMYRVAGRGDGGNRGALRRMTLGAYPLVDLKAARDKARAALDLADRGDDPADQRKDELRQKGERVFEVICARFVELHAKAHTVKWKDTDAMRRLGFDRKQRRFGGNPEHCYVRGDGSLRIVPEFGPDGAHEGTHLEGDVSREPF